jgi:membrane protease YdiL (CAAX protease family)
MPDLTYKDLALWQKILFITLVPLTAAFTEELIWRGHIISGFELRGRSSMQAVLLSALSFALIHGVFMPDRLLMTFLFGIVAGYYYMRERNLVPLMFAHWLVDLWGFGFFLII